MAVLASISTEHVIFGYNNTIEKNDDYQLHCHNFYEIYYFLEGDVDYLVEGNYYKPAPHSLLLLAPNVFHGVRVNSEKPYLRMALHFFPEVLSFERRAFLLSVFPGTGLEENRDVYYEDTAGEKIFPFLEALAECSTLPEDLRNPLIPIYLEGLLSRITVCQGNRRLQTEGSDASDPINLIIAYLNEHFTDRITLDLVADKFCISKHHLNKVFRKATGTTLCDYLTYKRILYAKQLLLGGHSAEEASLLSGFLDYSAFYRAYRKINGCSPIKDRGALPSLIQ